MCLMPKYKNSKSKMPQWFPRALAIAQLADKFGLQMYEAEWILKYKEANDDPEHWYCQWLFSKSMAMLQTRRKRLPAMTL